MTWRAIWLKKNCHHVNNFNFPSRPIILEYWMKSKFARQLCMLILVSSAVASATADQAPEAGSSTLSSDERECFSHQTDEQTITCVSDRLGKREKELEALVRDVMAGMPEMDSSDNRRNREVLARSQNAWKVYRDENCRYLGGVQGGNNKWVSYFEALCLLRETNHRIDFLRQPPRWG